MIRPYIDKSHKNGFTIVELIIVIVVIGILSAITYVSYATITKDAQTQGMQNDLQAIGGALNKFKASKGAHPAALSEVEVKTSSGADFTYRRDYATGTYCLSGTLKGTTSYIESGRRTTADGACPIINIATNPSFETNTTGISASNGTVSRVSGGAASGSWALTTTKSNSLLAPAVSIVISNRVKEGIQYTCSISLKSADATGVGSPVTFSLFDTGTYVFDTGMTTGEYGAKTINLTTAWQRVDTTMTVQAEGAQTLNARVRVAGEVNTIARIDALMCTEGSTVFTYGDGTKTGWSWLGTAHASASKGKPL